MWVIRGFARFTRFLISLLERIESIFRPSYRSQYFFMHRFRSYVVSYFYCTFLLYISALQQNSEKSERQSESRKLAPTFSPSTADIESTTIIQENPVYFKIIDSKTPKRINPRFSCKNLKNDEVQILETCRIELNS